MSKVSAVKDRKGLFSLYDHRGDLVGRVSTETGRALIGSAFYVRERTPDATASYKGWRVRVFDPDGKLVSPSLVAQGVVRAMAEGKASHLCEHWLDGECYALRTTRPVDRDALLALADEMDRAPEGGTFLVSPIAHSVARRIREALGVGK